MIKVLDTSVALIRNIESNTTPSGNPVDAAVPATYISTKEGPYCIFSDDCKVPVVDTKEGSIIWKSPRELTYSDLIVTKTRLFDITKISLRGRLLGYHLCMGKILNENFMTFIYREGGRYRRIFKNIVDVLSKLNIEFEAKEHRKGFYPQLIVNSKQLVDMVRGKRFRHLDIKEDGAGFLKAALEVCSKATIDKGITFFCRNSPLLWLMSTVLLSLGIYSYILKRRLHIRNGESKRNLEKLGIIVRGSKKPSPLPFKIPIVVMGRRVLISRAAFLRLAYSRVTEGERQFIENGIFYHIRKIMHIEALDGFVEYPDKELYNSGFIIR